MTSPPLSGLRVLDLSRILAGPTCTQLLSDLGAEVIKIERPGTGDDTRGWGPPFLKDSDGNDTRESAYYLSANRGKKSVALDISAPEGQAIVRDIAKSADILVGKLQSRRIEEIRPGLPVAARCHSRPHLLLHHWLRAGRPPSPIAQATTS